MIAPALELMETAAIASISTPPAVALISIALGPVPAELTVTVCVPPPTAANVKLLAKPVTVTLESFVPSIVTALPLISISPVVVISTSDAFPAIFTPDAPLIVIAPADVVKLDAAPAFNATPADAVTPTVVAPLNVVAPTPFITKLAFPSVRVNASTDVTEIAFAFTFTAVDAALPIWIVLAEAPEPMLMFCATASSPTLITPFDEFNDNVLTLSMSITLFAVRFIPPTLD